MAFLLTYAPGFLLLAVAAYLLYRAVLPKPIPGIPHNHEATSKIMGDVPDFMKWHGERKEIYTWLIAQCQKMNSPVIQVFMRPFGGRPWVILTDFREAQDIMTKRTREFDRSDFFGDLFTSILPHHHVHMPTGDEWRSHRKLVGDLMSPGFLTEAVAPQLYNTALDTIRLWKEKARLTEGRPFAAQDDVSHGALDVIWAAAFGSEIGTVKSQYSMLSKLSKIDLPNNVDSPAVVPTAQTPEAFNSIIKLTHSIEIATSSPIPRQHHWFALKFFPSLRSAGKHKDKLIQDRLDESWKKFTGPPDTERKISSALDYIVQREVTIARKENRHPQYDTPAIKDELFGFLIAGHDTTSTTITWGLKFLTSNQQVQANVRAALHTYHKRAHQAGEAPTANEIVKADIPYLDATIEEFLRVGNTAPANMRRALCDTQVLGYHIPKGTDIFMMNIGPGYMMSPLQVDDSKRSQSSIDTKDRYGVWEVADIGAFQPERWLEKNEKGELEFNPRAGPAHPFGAGPRGCFGRKLASMELQIIFTLVLWNFELQATPADLSSFAGMDVLTHMPQQCFLRLAETK